jgi:hypothetical protein
LEQLGNFQTCNAVSGRRRIQGLHQRFFSPRDSFHAETDILGINEFFVHLHDHSGNVPGWYNHIRNDHWNNQRNNDNVWNNDWYGNNWNDHWHQFERHGY